jgi:hypothetical protein
MTAPTSSAAPLRLAVIEISSRPPTPDPRMSDPRRVYGPADGYALGGVSRIHKHADFSARTAERDQTCARSPDRNTQIANTVPTHCYDSRFRSGVAFGRKAVRNVPFWNDPGSFAPPSPDRRLICCR